MDILLEENTRNQFFLSILSSLPSVPIVKLFLEPLLKYARIIFASDTFSRNKLKLFGSSLVNMMSISPDDNDPLRKDPNYLSIYGTIL